MHEKMQALRAQLAQRIVGQAALLDSLVLGLLCGGHVLLEGLPGLAKTTAVNSLAGSIDGRFARVQFTPDLLPSDITGAEIYHPDKHEFSFRAGPIFNEIVLADEINRAPAKVQAALLEAMSERQVSIAGESRQLPEVFMVLATQNPIEQSGTYPLPEAQMDRFIMQVVLDYPTTDEEQGILTQHLSGEKLTPLDSTVSVEEVQLAQQAVKQVHVAPEIQHYIVALVTATRDLPSWLPEHAEFVSLGASPRATLAIAEVAQARAYLAGRDFVLPEDVQAAAVPCMRHRMQLSVAARLANVTSVEIIDALLEVIDAP